MSLRILHIAPFNIAGVPITFVRAERELGFTSRLITLGNDRRNYEEDVCLDLPFLDFSGTRFIKKIVSHPGKLNVTNQRIRQKKIPVTWRPNSWAETALVKLRERIWHSRITSIMREIDFWNFDIYQLDGGLEFYRDGRVVKKLNASGKKVICCYTGSDLRTRGVIPEIDAHSDCNITLEFDHLSLHPDISHVFFPFETGKHNYCYKNNSHVLKIGHAPTNREAKGSAKIISAVKRIQSKLPVELILIENLTHKQALEMKAQCDIFIDQIGDLGYGLNSLESLAMGIPTCSCLVAGFVEKYPDHPFVVIDEHNIEQKLTMLVTKPELRLELSKKGRAWVERHHDSKSVVSRIHELASLSQESIKESVLINHQAV